MITYKKWGKLFHGSLAIAISVFFFVGLGFSQVTKENEECKKVEIREASGIARLGDKLVIVDDGKPGTYYPFDAPKAGTDIIPIPKLCGVKIPDGKQSQLGIDLEAIDILANSQVVVLSERLRALIGKDGILTEYDSPLSELGNRGLEGLAVRTLDNGSSRVAVLWEGGYPEKNDLPLQLQDLVGTIPFFPIIWVHDVGRNGELIQSSCKENPNPCRKLKEKDALKHLRLDVPKPQGTEPFAQRFRAPDLVWHQWDQMQNGKKEWGFIVLLSSESTDSQLPPDERFKHKWLQRFTMEGRPFSGPLDLSDVIEKGSASDKNKLKKANWEGLGWFEEGERLVLVYDDKKATPVAFLVTIPNDWK
ncbi:hypothetical protein [Candidatus Nitronereus thalassa]|uniref:Phytase-like domain-containing protein n=1 Tax=Candidatus Nitronereus thalassa TaxID=3020898 RepID=A0ABU3K9N2_9BACT|nr:hypothetical protein [Candidatus Nitronereus thalassa]MDT7043044.1 hypothetical protein [Candidatus Nitronereus thalassa]